MVPSFLDVMHENYPPTYSAAWPGPRLNYMLGIYQQIIPSFYLPCLSEFSVLVAFLSKRHFNQEQENGLCILEVQRSSFLRWDSSSRERILEEGIDQEYTAEECPCKWYWTEQKPGSLRAMGSFCSFCFLYGTKHRSGGIGVNVI